MIPFGAAHTYIQLIPLQTENGEKRFGGKESCPCKMKNKSVIMNGKSLQECGGQKGT